MGIDLTNTHFSVKLFANTLQANCAQVSRTIYTATNQMAGEVSTYGEVAAEAGFPGAARGVSGVLKKVGGLPWWRVTAASGRLIKGLESEQAQRLRAEGVTIRNGKIVG